jgi:hypothetical protein
MSTSDFSDEFYRIREVVKDRFRYSKLFGIYIQGVEATQAIQYYKSDAHLTDPADRQPDNSVRLVARKPVWVRVYVRGYRFQSSLGLPDVTGKLEISCRGFFGVFHAVSTIAPQPPGVVTPRRDSLVQALPDPFYAADRQNIGATLNFIVPGDVMCGYLRFHVTVSNTQDTCVYDELTLDFDVTLQQTLSVRGIMIGYNGPSSFAPNAPTQTLAAPTIGDLQTTAAWTLLVYPVRSEATFGNAGAITWNLPLTDLPSCSGCCSPNWNQLMAQVQAQMVADGNLPNVLYYGLMADGIPMGPVIGCGAGGVGTGSAGEGVTMAHELGHACGLPHSPCGVVGDPTYPAYEPYDPAGQPKASIGEYGLNINTGDIMSPSTHKDWMSYCGPEWVSLYNYGRLLNNHALNPALVCLNNIKIPYKEYEIVKPFDPEPPPLRNLHKDIYREMRPVISLIGLMHAEDQIEIVSVMRLETTPVVQRGRETDLTAELLGAEGRVLASALVYRLPPRTLCNCGENHEEGPPYLLQAFIPDVGRGDALRIRTGPKELWSRQAPKAEPQLTAFEAALKDSRLSVKWTLEVTSDTKEGWLQWSVDGKRWNALATRLRGERATIDATGLPAGKVQIRLLAGDGFHTVQSKPMLVEVPQRPPVVSILAPRNAERLMAGGSMRLWGVVSDGSGKAVTVKRAVWLLDGKKIADVLDHFVNVPTEGKHELALVVTTEGGESKQTVRFIAVSAKEE